MSHTLSNQHYEESGDSFGWIRKVLVFLFICVFVAALVIQSISTWRSYQATLAKAEQEMLLLARAFDQHVGRTMEGTLSSLNTIEQDEIFQSCLQVQDTACLHAYMLRFVGRYPQLSSMSLVDENGVLAVSSLMYPAKAQNVCNSEFFRVVRSRAQAPFYSAEQQGDRTGAERTARDRPRRD